MQITSDSQSKNTSLLNAPTTTHRKSNASFHELEDSFISRHLGPRESDVERMLPVCGFDSMDALIDAAIPRQIRSRSGLSLPEAASERDALMELRAIADKNTVAKSYIGLGYTGTITPPVILRNIFENPGWYTQYTPYQAEIAQGRLEALLNFQTMIADLTGLDIANASLLDEGTAAAEAMAMSFASKGKSGRNRFLVSERCYPQTIEVVRTRAVPLGIEVVVANERDFKFDNTVFGVLLQYPAADGELCEYAEFVVAAHSAGALVTVAADILALALLTPPGEWGADIAVGSTQRFGVPMGFGGPHAGYFATRDAFKRSMPGRIVGVSRDADGNPAFRLALQTREQHIRREKATSNICTAQVLLAVMASMYAVYHGPGGIRRIATRVHRLTRALAEGLKTRGAKIVYGDFFDTLCVRVSSGTAISIVASAEECGINLRLIDESSIGITVDEQKSPEDIAELLSLFGEAKCDVKDLDGILDDNSLAVPSALIRESSILQHPVFSRYHSETEMQRYIRRLESRDLSLTTSMIPLGSCTMKLNAAAEMLPVTWPEFGEIHPFAPENQFVGYRELFVQLERWLADITGFDAVSLQPNAGSQGEFAGLMAIRGKHEGAGEAHRNVCLIPQSAHGTNPASAVMAGMKVVPVRCDDAGNIDVEDLRSKAESHGKELAGLMITYPSTHGVFEETIREICEIIHANGGLVYMDGANMNAQVGLCKPGDLGADVCHLNLHKTFCIPHGGGGPGMGPICTTTELAPFLPSHPLANVGGEGGEGPISAAPWGSASILVISWMYIRMTGTTGLTNATHVAILNANYIAKRVSSSFPILYTGKTGLVAHECIVDLRQFKKVTVEDVAKRLMDYGFHAPTISWPVPGTMMIEPTESESLEELDRFCDAMIKIYEEIQAVESGAVYPKDNLLKNAPHTARLVTNSNWTKPYTREEAAYPVEWLRTHKFWPAVSRIDNVFGDRNPVCSCVGMDEYSE